MLRIPDPRRFSLRGDIWAKQCIAPLQANRIIIFFDLMTETCCASPRFLPSAPYPRYTQKNTYEFTASSWANFPRILPIQPIPAHIALRQKLVAQFIHSYMPVNAGNASNQRRPKYDGTWLSLLPSSKTFHSLSSPRS